MMLAKLAYLTTPAPDIFILNFQVDHEGEGAFVFQFEISKAHLANILIDGTALALRETSIHRVPVSLIESASNGPTAAGA